MFIQFTSLAIAILAFGCGSSHSGHSDDAPAPKREPNPTVANGTNSSTPTSTTAGGTTPGTALQSPFACRSLPPLSDRSLPLYGNWAAPRTQDGDTVFVPVFAFRPGKVVIQLTCVSEKGSVCVETESSVVATADRFKLADSFAEVSRTENGNTCTIRKFRSSFDVGYRVSGSTLTLKNFVDEETVWTAVP